MIRREDSYRLRNANFDDSWIEQAKWKGRMLLGIRHSQAGRR